MKKNEKLDSKIDTMGGQAVIEGVMMRSPQGYSIAVRKASEEIKVKSVAYRPLSKRIKLLGLPFLRGTVTLFEMLIIGIKALDFSASEWEEASAKQKDKKAKEPDSAQSKTTDETPQTEARPSGPSKESKGLSVAGLVLMMVLSFGLAMFLVVVLPNFLTSYLGRVDLFGASPEQQVLVVEPDLGLEAETPTVYQSSERSALVEEQSPLIYNLIAGVFRASIIFAYVLVISLLKDIRRIFQYHGAEHKTVFAFEKGEELTVENVKKYSTMHPRCGTTFLAIVIFISIIVFSAIAWIVISLYPPFTTWNFLVKKGILISLHILFMPLVAGSAYEIIKYAGRHQNQWFWRGLVYPGLLFQRITTKEPDDKQLEVAIASLRATLAIGQDTRSVIEPGGES
jgi:uncharacterized protein YqhQ